MEFINRRNQALKSARGFTLIELLIVISILGVLAGVVVLNVIGFIGAGHDEAKAVELKQVGTAIGAYMFEGHPTLTPTAVGPSDPGILEDYLIGDLQYYWSIDSDGSVHEILYGSSLSNLDGFNLLSGGWTSGPGGLSSNGVDGSLLATNGNWTDFTFQTTAALTSGDGYGLYYLSNSSASTGYIFQLTTSGFTISSVADGTILAQAPLPSSFAVNGQHNISVSVSGGNHTIQVDGNTVLTLSGQAISSGTVGLQSGASSNVNFTGFTVSPP